MPDTPLTHRDPKTGKMVAITWPYPTPPTPEEWEGIFADMNLRGPTIGPPREGPPRPTLPRPLPPLGPQIANPPPPPDETGTTIRDETWGELFSRSSPDQKLNMLASLAGKGINLGAGVATLAAPGIGVPLRVGLMGLAGTLGGALEGEEEPWLRGVEQAALEGGGALGAKVFPWLGVRTGAAVGAQRGINPKKVAQAALRERRAAWRAGKHAPSPVPEDLLAAYRKGGVALGDIEKIESRRGAMGRVIGREAEKSPHIMDVSEALPASTSVETRLRSRSSTPMTDTRAVRNEAQQFVREQAERLEEDARRTARRLRANAYLKERAARPDMSPTGTISPRVNPQTPHVIQAEDLPENLRMTMRQWTDLGVGQRAAGLPTLQKTISGEYLSPSLSIPQQVGAGRGTLMMNLAKQREPRLRAPMRRMSDLFTLEDFAKRQQSPWSAKALASRAGMGAATGGALGGLAQTVDPKLPGWQVGAPMGAAAGILGATPSNLSRMGYFLGDLSTGAPTAIRFGDIATEGWTPQTPDPLAATFREPRLRGKRESRLRRPR